VQHRDAVGDVHDDLHLVLDQDDGAPLGDAADQVDGLVRLLRAHAGRGLVEQEERRVGAERDAELEVALLAVGEVGGQQLALVPEADLLQDGAGLVADAAERHGAPPEVEREAVGLRGHADVLEDGEVREDVGDLVRLRDAEARDPVLRQAGDLPAFEPDPAGGGRHLARDQPEEGRLARAVRADDRAQLAALDLEVHLRDGHEAAEASGQALGADDGGGHGGGAGP